MTNTMKSLLALCLFCGAAAVSTAETPVRHTSFKPGEIWTDNNGVHINAHGGGILYDKGTYYWYGEHKVEGDAGNRAQVGVHCYSSRDLYNWKDEGIALKVVEGDNSHPIAKGCILERPKVVYNKKTKKYVMWFHLELKGKGYGAAYAGVATATKPTGPFTFLKAGRVNPGKWPLNLDKKDQTTEFTKEMPDYVRIIRRDFPGGQMSRDMTIFVDDNGKAYHIYSSEGNITLHIAELTPDYTGHNGKYVRVFVNRYMEAPAICKHNGKYYMIASGCSGWAPNAARSAVAPAWPDRGRSSKIPAWGPRPISPSADKAPTSCPYRASPANSSSWRTSGGPRTPLTAAICGFPSSLTETRSNWNGKTNGNWKTCNPIHRQHA